MPIEYREAILNSAVALWMEGKPRKSSLRNRLLSSPLLSHPACFRQPFPPSGRLSLRGRSRCCSCCLYRRLDRLSIRKDGGGRRRRRGRVYDAEPQRTVTGPVAEFECPIPFRHSRQSPLLLLLLNSLLLLLASVFWTRARRFHCAFGFPPSTLVNVLERGYGEQPLVGHFGRFGPFRCWDGEGREGPERTGEARVEVDQGRGSPEGLGRAVRGRGQNAV